MHRIAKLSLWVFLAVKITACTTIPPVPQRLALAERLAAGAGLLPMTTTTTPPLKGFARLQRDGADITVYIEGDGLAWISPTIPSPDPTPINPVALTLAAVDPAANVVYLGRPGQYFLAMGEDRRYWLSARFSPEVIAAYVSAILELAAAQKAPVIHLVGYSGGAAIAALAASRLKQGGKEGAARPLTLRTVAGNLDTQLWTHRLRLSPLEGSLNPAHEALALQDVPQLHLVGSRDRQVPAPILDSFLGHMSSQACVHVITVNAAHGGPWVESWLQVLGRTPACAH